MIAIARIPPCRAIVVRPVISDIAAGSSREGKGSIGMADAPDLLDRQSSRVARKRRDGKICGRFPHVSSRLGVATVANVRRDAARPLHLININNGWRRAI
jgi:hypothetical protein